MELAKALSKPAGLGRVPSEERLENQNKFLVAWRLLLENRPAYGSNPSFFSFLSEQDALRLLDMGKQKTLQKGHRIYARGDRAFFFGLVLQGTCVQTEMQDLRLRPQTVETRGSMSSGSRAGTAPAGAIELHSGDTFGEIPLTLDGQLVGGKRESTLHVADDDQVEQIVFTVDYTIFASFMQDLDLHIKGRESTHRQQAPTLTIASRLLPKVLPKSENDAPWLVNKKTTRGDTFSVTASEEFSPSKKKSKVLDAPPVTMLNMDILMECAWMAKRTEGIVSDTTRAILGSETKMPHTVVFRDGEPVHWYFGWMSGLKRRSKEHVTTWQMLEDFCKGTDAGQLVAIMTCCKRGNAMGTEHVQSRLLDKRKLERVLSGAKSNRLTGYIQKYQRVETLATEYVLQCCWSNTSFTVDWVPETMVECLSHVHKPSRMDPGGLKKLHEKMNCKYHQYVPGTLSTLGDYFNSSTIKLNPLRQLDGRSKARARQFNDGTDAKAGNIVEREIRDTVKTACQQIASMFDKILNKSASARKKATDDAAEFSLNHNPSFTLIRTMNCFFKVNKDGQPSLLHCTAAVAHPDTKQPLTQLSRDELLNPSEETFFIFAGYGAEHSRLSGLGERAVLLDFSEFLQLLTKKELLYEHVSITDASLCFKQACHSLNAEEGQLKFPEYCECMCLLRARMGLDDAGNPKYQASSAHPGGFARAASMYVGDVDNKDVDERLAGVMSVRRQQDLERGRLGGMFAANIVEKMAVKDVERRCAERDRKHDERTADRRKRVAVAAEAERKAQEMHRQKAQAQAAKRQADAEENALRSWEKIQRTNQTIMQKRDEEAKMRQAAIETRRAASLEQRKVRRMAEEHRNSEVTKRSELLLQHRTKVCSKQKAVKESTKEYQYIAVREKEVVRHMFHEYVRTGHLARPWGLDVLHGDALPSLIHITTEKSKGHAGPQGTDGSAQDKLVASLLSVIPEKGRTKVRSHSSFD